MRRSRTYIEVGGKYGRWTVIRFDHKSHDGRLNWLAKCDCGTVKTVIGPALLSGASKSCGCLWHETITTHGMTKTRTFKSWDSMLQRCTNPNAPDYHRYGAVGIKVCDRWKESFNNFLVDMGERPAGKTLDRIDVKKDYTPENCKWSTASEQQRNKNNNRYITFRDETKLVKDWAILSGLEISMIWARFKRGVRGDDLFAPGYSRKPKPEFVEQWLK
jgi:hypothetical protein